MENIAPTLEHMSPEGKRFVETTLRRSALGNIRGESQLLVDIVEQAAEAGQPSMPFVAYDSSGHECPLQKGARLIQ
jgi:hypothetical protein